MSYLDIFTMASDALAGEPSQTALETIELLVNSKGIIDSRSIVISLVLRAIMEEDFEFQTQCGNGSLRSIRRSVDEVTLGLLFHLQVQFPDDKSMDEVYPNQITLEDLPTLLGLTGIVLGLYRRTDIPRKRLDDWVPQYIKTCCQITTSLRQLEVTCGALSSLQNVIDMLQLYANEYRARQLPRCETTEYTGKHLNRQHGISEVPSNTYEVRYLKHGTSCLVTMGECLRNSSSNRGYIESGNTRAKNSKMRERNVYSVPGANEPAPEIQKLIDTGACPFCDSKSGMKRDDSYFPLRHITKYHRNEAMGLGFWGCNLCPMVFLSKKSTTTHFQRSHRDKK